MGTFYITRNVEAEIEWRFKLDTVTPMDLTGYSVLVQIRPTSESSSTYVTYNQSSSEIDFDPVNGSIKLTLPPSITGAFMFKKGVIDCLVRDGIDVDGERSPIYDVVVNWGVSRP